MKTTILFFLILIFWFPSNAQSSFDTDSAALKNAWRRIYKSDQSNRGSDSNDSIDSANLLKACQLIKKYGYPKKKNLGKIANAAWLPWIHVNGYSKKKATLGIINLGYGEGEIKKFAYHRYFLRSLFLNKFGFAPKLAKTNEVNISALLNKIGVDSSTELNLKKISTLCSVPFVVHPENEKQVIGKWIIPKEPLSRGKRGGKVEIYLHQNRYYYRELFKDYEAQELLPCHALEDIFVFNFKNNHDFEKLKITSEAELIMLNKDDEIIVKYLKYITEN